MTKTNFYPNDNSAITGTKPKITLPASAPLNMRGQIIFGAETDSVFETSLVNYKTLTDYVAANGALGSLSWKANTSYLEGEFVIQSAKLYIAKNDVMTSSSFDSANWLNIFVSIEDIKSAYLKSVTKNSSIVTLTDQSNNTTTITETPQSDWTATTKITGQILNKPTTITVAQANAIIANTNKTGITLAQSTAITANTAKEGITILQKNNIATNNAKIGITSNQAAAIIVNTAKTGITTDQLNNINSSFSNASFNNTSRNLILTQNSGLTKTLNIPSTDSSGVNKEIVTVNWNNETAYAKDQLVKEVLSNGTATYQAIRTVPAGEGKPSSAPHKANHLAYTTTSEGAFGSTLEVRSTVGFTDSGRFTFTGETYSYTNKSGINFLNVIQIGGNNPGSNPPNLPGYEVRQSTVIQSVDKATANANYDSAFVLIDAATNKYALELEQSDLNTGIVPDATIGLINGSNIWQATIDQVVDPDGVDTAGHTSSAITFFLDNASDATEINAIPSTSIINNYWLAADGFGFILEHPFWVSEQQYIPDVIVNRDNIASNVTDLNQLKDVSVRSYASTLTFKQNEFCISEVNNNHYKANINVPANLGDPNTDPKFDTELTPTNQTEAIGETDYTFAILLDNSVSNEPKMEVHLPSIELAEISSGSLRFTNGNVSFTGTFATKTENRVAINITEGNRGAAIQVAGVTNVADANAVYIWNASAGWKVEHINGSSYWIDITGNNAGQTPDFVAIAAQGKKNLSFSAFDIIDNSIEYKAVASKIYNSVTYFRVKNRGTNTTKQDGWNTLTTTTSIGTKLSTAQREF